MPKLKPCPFCNSTHYGIGYVDESKRFMAVSCRHCGATGSLVMADYFYLDNPNKSRKEAHKEMREWAIKLWNKRSNINKPRNTKDNYIKS